jgi:exonuclease SbcC
MPIESVKLTFQKHRGRVLRLTPGVNVLTGPTNAGKSSVLRGIGWAVLNQPSGNRFVPWDAPAAKVVLKLDGHTVVRKRGKENYYKLDGKKYVSFGPGGVPDEVRAVIGLDHVNFQWQLDPPFWFLESAGQVSKNLNRIVNLESIDKTLSTVATNLRKARSVLEVTGQRLKDAKERLAGLRWVKEFNRDLTTLEGLERQHQIKSRLLDEISSLASNAKRLLERKETLSLATKRAVKLLDKAKAVGDAQARRETLSRLIREAKAAEASKDREVPDVTRLEFIRNDADKLSERRRFLEMLIQRTREAVEWQRSTQKELKRAAGELKEATDGRCPVCQTQLPSSHPIFTSATSHPYVERKKVRIGTRSWSGTSGR